MGILDLVKSDWKSITTNTNDFGVDITLTTPTDSQSIEIVGLATRHHLGINSEGLLVNSRNVHVSFSEQQLIDESYPYLDANNEVNIKKHKVTFNDSRGDSRTYIIKEFFPDETIGVIVCILGAYDTVVTDIFDNSFDNTFN